MWTDGLAIVLGVGIAALLGWWIGFRHYPKPDFWRRYWFVISFSITILVLTMIGIPVVGYFAGF